jgi:hypothetical protein
MLEAGWGGEEFSVVEMGLQGLNDALPLQPREGKAPLAITIRAETGGLGGAW